MTIGHLLCADAAEECTETMAAKKRQRRTNRSNPHSRPAPTETRAAEAVTIAWTVTVTMLVVCELMGLAAVLYIRSAPDAAGVRSLAGAAQVCALTLAVICLTLMVVVYRVRRVRPPVAYTAFAVVVTLVPFIAAAWNALR